MRCFNNRLSYLLNAILMVAFLYACSTTGPDPGPPLQTRILEVKVEPNPVAVGDTATFTCIIEDSLDKRFKFSWGEDNVLGDTITTENTIEWIAPNKSGEYVHTVTAFNSSPDSVTPTRTFIINVVN